jgi:Zn-dependent protease with chaperone function
MKLALASLFTLGLLFAFLLAIIWGVFYSIGIIEFWILITFTGIIFFFWWLLSPRLSDIIFQWLYKLQWVGLEGLKEKDAEVARFVREVCYKNKIKVPKIGFINDDNPQAFCYGSGAFNARIVFTQGIFTYLNTEERKAVLGHEIGHIVHRDFVIMTLAAFIVSLLYHISQAFLRDEDRKERARIIGAFAYAFYWVGTYILLFLSRIREYYADEFSARTMGESDPLVNALIKIAYGIIANPDEKRQVELMQGTRTLGIIDYKAARGIGLSYFFSMKMKSLEPLHKTFLYDLKNPWAFVYELNSSHPLTAKRIKRLEKIYDVTVFDLNSIESYPIDKKKLYANFFTDVFFHYLPIIFTFVFLATVATLTILGQATLRLSVITFFIGLGLSLIIRTLYRYPNKPPKKATILELMEDVYASPIKGRPVVLEGNIVGRGVPGLILSEDMLLQDETGLIYLNYEGLIPLLSNLMFAFLKLEKLLDRRVEACGWFIRGLNARLELNKVVVEGEEIKSWVRAWNVMLGIVIILIGVFIFLLFLLL